MFTTLASIIGPEYLTEHDQSFCVQGCTPRFVAAPGSVEQLAELVACAHEANLAVVPWGGGTQQRLGNPLQLNDRPLLVIRTERLRSVVAYEPADLTISVEAGIPLAELAAVLAGNGQMLPVDVPLPQRATLGGALATAMDGPRRLGYGTWRDLLIGIRVVEATGRVSKAGGMVVKNVSGFDMMKLYLGSLGSLAIIVSANFKLLPLPRAAATLWCACPDAQSAWRLLEQLHASQLQPVAAELILAFGLPILEVPIGATRSTIVLAIGAEGHSAAVERHLRDIQRMARECGATTDTLEHEAHRSLWARIADLPQTAELAAGELLLRISCLPGQLAAALAATETTAQAHGLALFVHARALNGVAYVRLAGAANSGAQAGCVATLRTQVPQAHITMLGQNTLGTIAPWGEPPAGQELMQRIKAEFDPQNMLNPGRYVV